MSHARARGAALGHLVPPGTYTVRLDAGGRQATTQIHVRKDPTSLGTDADVAAQAQSLALIRQDLSTVTALITEAESVRAQLATLRALLERRREGANLIRAIEDVDRKLFAIEDNLFQMDMADFQDAFRMPRRLYEKLLSLAFDVGTDSADHAPTTQQVQVQAMYHQQVTAAVGRMNEAIGRDLAALNAVLRRNGIANIVTQQAAAPTSSF
jgi:hypothetical protein